MFMVVYSAALSLVFVCNDDVLEKYIKYQKKFVTCYNQFNHINHLDIYTLN